MATIPLLTKESSGTLYLADAYQGNNIFIHKGNLNTNSYTVNLGTTGIFRQNMLIEEVGHSISGAQRCIAILCCWI